MDVFGRQSKGLKTADEFSSKFSCVPLELQILGRGDLNCRTCSFAETRIDPSFLIVADVVRFSGIYLIDTAAHDANDMLDGFARFPTGVVLSTCSLA